MIGHGWPAAAIAAATLFATAARADGPEQLEQIEPAGGAWQAELSGGYGREQAYSLSMLYGASDRLALGVEVEAARAGGPLRVDTIGLVALLRLRDPVARPLGIGLEVQLGFDRDARIAESEGRVILERRAREWWLQGDAIIRHTRDEDAETMTLAYAASAQHSLAEDLWLGVEASGQAARLDHASGALRGGHYLGPSLTLERPIGRGDVEMGLAYLWRIAGQGPRSAPRFFVQASF